MNRRLTPAEVEMEIARLERAKTDLTEIFLH